MDLIQGAVDPQGGYVSKILHVKMKESGPVGGRAPGAPPLDPPMVSNTYLYYINIDLRTSSYHTCC